MPQVAVIRVETVGKGGSQRTVHHLSNGWWINDQGTRGHREHRFSLYRPGAGGSREHATFVKSDSKLKRLLDYVNAL